jgi:hypothetical protein
LPIFIYWVTADIQWSLVQIIMHNLRLNKVKAVEQRPAAYPGIWYSSNIGMESFLHLR